MVKIQSGNQTKMIGDVVWMVYDAYRQHEEFIDLVEVSLILDEGVTLDDMTRDKSIWYHTLKLLGWTDAEINLGWEKVG